jgi:glutaconate CoA-transferase subunit A
MTRPAQLLQAGPVQLPHGQPERKDVTASAADVVARVADGATVAIGGFVTANHPMPLVRELIRQRKKDLTVIGAATAGLEVDLLIGAGVVRKLIAPYCGAELYAPIGSCFRAAVEAGQLQLWECSEYILYAGLQARAMGQDFFAWRGGIGTSIPELNPDLKVFTSPLGDGKEYLAVPAIPVDWTFLHVGVADKYGNGQHPGARFGDRIMARAADRVAVTCERVVGNEQIRRNPIMTSVPYADAVVEAPHGSHPYASHGFYAEDAEHIQRYVAATAAVRRGNRSGLDAYLDEYVTGPASHDDYLDRVGRDRLQALEAEYQRLSYLGPLGSGGLPGSTTGGTTDA